MSFTSYFNLFSCLLFKMELETVTSEEDLDDLVLIISYNNAHVMC